MATMVGTQKDLAKLLNALIELDFDAIEAYKAAIQRLNDVNDKSQLSSFLGDHQRHVSELQPLVEAMGQEAAKRADVKQILAKGKVVIAGLVGDRMILMAMKSNEDDTNTAYERAVNRNDLPENLREVLVRNLGDERRHREYLERRLEESSQRPVHR